MTAQQRVLLVDLNNFARYPTLPIGYLATILRTAGYEVKVFAPLMIGVKGVSREPAPGRFDLFKAKLNHRIATARSDAIRLVRDQLAMRRLSGVNEHANDVVAAASKVIDEYRPSAVLVSTYLMYRDVCARLCDASNRLGVPMIVGGPYFAQREVIRDWVRIPGLSALIAGEVELRLPSIVASVIAGEDASAHEGVFCAGSDGVERGSIAAPLRELDKVPFPDYSDFPWSAYPNRIVPIITGRGCGWGACSFCSDVTSTAGRTYRSRSAANVLNELAFHYAEHKVSRFVFTDLKLNSDTSVWRSVIGGIQGVAPGAKWIAAVHAGKEVDNGLSARDLKDAAKAGCVRLTTGLETGSQTLSNLMKKGTKVETIAHLLENATTAGISTRCTMVLGFPGETVDDVHASADFLSKHGSSIERISLNRLSLIMGTTLHRSAQRKPARVTGIEILREQPSHATVSHRNTAMHSPAHRKATFRLLTEAHRINSKQLSSHARDFDGVM